MSKNSGPVERFMNGAIMLLVGTVAIWLSLQVLSNIWGWLLLIALIIGVTATGVAVALYFFRRSRSHW